MAVDREILYQFVIIVSDMFVAVRIDPGEDFDFRQLDAPDSTSQSPSHLTLRLSHT